MVKNIPLEEISLIRKKRKRLQGRAIVKSKLKIMLSLSISLALIAATSLLVADNLYVYSNSKDLEFVVERNFTSGFSPENKLLRVQRISLVYYDTDTAIVEAFGLSKEAPHKSTSIKGSFKRDSNDRWVFEKFILSD